MGERMDYEHNPFPKLKHIALTDAAAVKKLPAYNYAVVATWNYMMFETGYRNSLKELLEAMKGWRLVKVFYYDENLLWNPRPTYTCPTVFIFKRDI